MGPPLGFELNQVGLVEVTMRPEGRNARLHNINVISLYPDRVDTMAAICGDG